MTTAARVKAWLLGRPQPRQPARRIQTAARLAFLAAVVAFIRLAPRSWLGVFGDVLWAGIAVCAAVLVVLFARAWHRGREARRARG